MKKSRYVWYLSFELFENSLDLPIESITLSEEDEDYKDVISRYADRIVSASIYDKHTGEIVHYIYLEEYTFLRTFRRQEFDSSTRRTRTIPVIEVEKAGSKLFGFVYEDTVIFTEDSKFYREG